MFRSPFTLSIYWNNYINVYLKVSMISAYESSDCLNHFNSLLRKKDKNSYNLFTHVERLDINIAYAS